MMTSGVPAEFEKYRGGRGYPELHRANIDQCPVKGIDIEQVRDMILFCPETCQYLYTTYTPTKPPYRPGSRPKLEKIARGVITGYEADWEKAQALLGWVNSRVVHPVGRAEESPPDRAASEEAIIESGWGWCNEQSRVYAALVQTVGLMSRMCFISHRTKPIGHTPTETFLDGRWVFTDPMVGLLLRDSSGRMYSAGDVHRDPAARAVADDQYHRAHIQQIQRWLYTNPGHDAAKQKQDPLNSEWFGYVSLCNYFI